jgi:hypothetical protein
MQDLYKINGKVYLFLYGLFNDAVSSSDYTVSNGKMISKNYAGF